jgi:hypothetical protein
MDGALKNGLERLKVEAERQQLGGYTAELRPETR